MVGIADPLPNNDLPDDVPAVQPQPQDLNIQDPAQPRAHRTHKDDFISSLLSKLSLREKLSKNKEIEDQNKNREKIGRASCRERV